MKNLRLHNVLSFTIFFNQICLINECARENLANLQSHGITLFFFFVRCRRTYFLNKNIICLKCYYNKDVNFFLIVYIDNKIFIVLLVYKILNNTGFS